jgi:hypothetical protein
MLLMLAVHVVMSPCVHDSSLLSHPDHPTTFILGIQLIPLCIFYMLLHRLPYKDDFSSVDRLLYVHLWIGRYSFNRKISAHHLDVTYFITHLQLTQQRRHSKRFSLTLRASMDRKISPYTFGYSPLTT